jgi:hypothetical protein
MLATHQDAERRYDELRRVALEVAQESAAPSTRFGLIDPSALAQARTWEGAESRQVTWEWFTGYAAFKYQYPKRFEVALWERGNLIGLSLGRPTYNGGNLRMDFVEARPRTLGPRGPVFGSIDAAYEIYASLLNVKQIRIMNPINPIVREFYQSFGYQYVASKKYSYRDL